jgi:Domain of unknown function (DUF4411)
VTQQRYLFDSDSLINPHRNYYNQSIVPKFWDWIVEGIDNKIFYTIDKVANEILKGDVNDPLCLFIKNNPSFVLPTKEDLPCIKIYADLQKWANNTWAVGKLHNGGQKALDEFADDAKADAYLIAYAKAYNFKIVSFEVSEINRKTKIKIPDAAKPQGVDVIDLFELLSIHSHNNFDFKL